MTTEKNAKKRARWRAMKEKVASARRADCAMVNRKYRGYIGGPAMASLIRRHCARHEQPCPSREHCFKETFKIPLNCPMGVRKKMKNVKYQAACVECRLSGTRCLFGVR